MRQCQMSDAQIIKESGGFVLLLGLGLCTTHTCTTRATMTAVAKPPVTVKDVGLVQGLLVVAAQLKKYGRDGLDTNSTSDVSCQSAQSSRERAVASVFPYVTYRCLPIPADHRPPRTTPLMHVTPTSQSREARQAVPSVPRDFMRGLLFTRRTRVRGAVVSGSPERQYRD
jgi:hypothetical protein